MKVRILLRLTPAALLFAAMMAASANAQTIGAEDDTWTTGSGTQVDFANFGNINLGQMLGSAPTSTSSASFTTQTDTLCAIAVAN